jgi:hypothetical protein
MVNSGTASEEEELARREGFWAVTVAGSSSPRNA